MSATQSIPQEEIELRIAGPTPSTIKTFDSPGASSAPDPTHLQSGDNPSVLSSPDHAENSERRPDDEPAEGAVEVAPEGGYGWAVVAACSVAMWVIPFHGVIRK